VTPVGILEYRKITLRTVASTVKVLSGLVLTMPYSTANLKTSASINKEKAPYRTELPLYPRTVRYALGVSETRT
jgi:hypothetical protein